jgi:acyl carrier protein
LPKLTSERTFSAVSDRPAFLSFEQKKGLVVAHAGTEMTNHFLAHVQEIFGLLFGIDPRSVSLATTASEIHEWDSVGHLSLCGALEEALQIRFTVNEMAEMNNVSTIVSIIEAKKGILKNGVRGA